MKREILAILPEPMVRVGIVSRIYYTDNIEIDKRTPTHFLKNSYDRKGKSKKLVDKKIKAKTQIKRNYPYVIDKDHVFFAFKIRESKYDDQQRGFVNVKYVDKIQGSTIILTTGEEISSLNTEKTLLSNRKNAQLLYYMSLVETMTDNFMAIQYVRENLMD